MAGLEEKLFKPFTTYKIKWKQQIMFNSETKTVL